MESGVGSHILQSVRKDDFRDRGVAVEGPGAYAHACLRHRERRGGELYLRGNEIDILAVERSDDSGVGLACHRRCGRESDFLQIGAPGEHSSAVAGHLRDVLRCSGDVAELRVGFGDYDLFRTLDIVEGARLKTDYVVEAAVAPCDLDGEIEF